MAEVYPAPTQPAPAPKKKRGWLMTGCLSLAVLVVICGAISIVMNSAGNDATDTAASGAIVDPTGEPEAVVDPAGATEVPADPTATLEPTIPPEPTPTVAPTAAPVGTTRESAAPVGEVVTTSDGWEIKVNGIERNASATLKEMNQFNSDALPDYEWVLVNLSATYQGNGAETQTLIGNETRLTGSRGVIYTYPGVSMEKAFEGEVFKDGTIEGTSAFQVSEGETNLIVIFDSGPSGAAYLATGEVMPPIVQPVEPEAAMDAGISRQAPATGPVIGDDGIQIRVLDVERNATARVKEENQFNDNPAAGMEFVLVQIQTQ